MPQSEHILLESEVWEVKVPHPRASRKVHARIDVKARLRRRALRLEIIDYYYLMVRLHRSRSVLAEYVVDLRFVDPSVRLSRHIASRWLLVTLGLMALAIGIAFRIDDSAVPGTWLAACATVSVMAVGAALVFLYRTTETVTVYSAHGRAKLLEFTSGLGAMRAVRPFLIKLGAHIKLSAAARRPSISHHLRDEMREHFRLRETGVLRRGVRDQQRRILAEHSRC
jgi:hypothetical protein